MLCRYLAGKAPQFPSQIYYHSHFERCHHLIRFTQLKRFTSFTWFIRFDGFTPFIRFTQFIYKNRTIVHTFIICVSSTSHRVTSVKLPDNFVTMRTKLTSLSFTTLILHEDVIVTLCSSDFWRVIWIQKDSYDSKDSYMVQKKRFMWFKGVIWFTIQINLAKHMNLYESLWILWIIL